jgi:hypothetical protein
MGNLSVEMSVAIFKIMVANTTLHLTVLATRRKTNGKYIIYIAITHKRIMRYIATEYEIDDLFQFDSKSRRVVCRKDDKIINQRLIYILSEYQKKLDEIEDKHIYNCSQIKKILDCYGKTPMQTWRDGIHLAKDKLLDTHYQNFVSLPLSGEVETGSAGEQPASNNPTDWNCLVLKNLYR